MKRKLLQSSIYLVLLCIFCFVLVQERERQQQKREGKHIALVMKSSANEFFLTMESAARRHQLNSKIEYRLTANGIDNETDVSGQMEIVENMIAQEVDAIIIAPADSKALITVCERAIREGIVVINIDNRFDQGTLKKKQINIPYIGPDNRKAAYSVGEYLAQHLSYGERVAIIDGVTTAINAQERMRGFTDAFKQYGLKIVARESGEWEMERAHNVVISLLNEYPHLKGIACSNDSMALGAVAALRAVGKIDKVHVVGFDNISAVQEMLERGYMLATADQYPGRIVVEGIDYALELLDREYSPIDLKTPVRLVTASSMQIRE